MSKVWKIKENGHDDIIVKLASELNINKILATLLVQRGIRTFEQARTFFRPSLNDLHDPFLMKDMDKAIERIDKALAQGEKILVYGDYDVDGTTSVAMVYSFLKKFHDKLDYYIPDRYLEGYGISYKGIEYAALNKIKLIIALDCGIKAVDKIQYAKERGIDFIICDHHTPGEKIPEASAVLDPDRPGCDYPYKHLSGCGVGFKMLQAYCTTHKLSQEQLHEYLDILAVSIASDIVPITGENRTLAYFGLKRLAEYPRIGLKTIITMAGIENKPITIEDIVFKIGPRINAAGRIESGRQAVELLIAETPDIALLHCEKVNTFNQTRRNIDKNMTDEALKEIEHLGLKYKYSTVLYNPSWHKGVVGIVASRLIETYYRPTIVLTESNGWAAGSARSVPGFDLYEAISKCSDLLENFGGHRYAAGLTLKPDNITLFRDRFEKAVSQSITPEQLIPQVEIDTELNLKDISGKLFNILKQFEPFGPENMNPVFFAENVVDNGKGRVVGTGEEHLKLCLVQEDGPYNVFDAIAFNQSQHYSKISKGIGFDIAFSLNENTFRGNTSIQLNIKDIKIE
ncbi:MAG: single-stranded-DNA-specific exonuclease RecJ [Bacteroidales bacterium]|nr:single-stranded-DNA-specific exonuclease RecJ [Bacteroidales bacterium]